MCQGNMFRPYKVIIRPSKKTDPRAVLCFAALWDPKCKYSLGSHNAVKQNTALGSVFLEGLMMTLYGRNMSP